MYECQEPGCDRTFKRSEHLSRHRLNHQPRRVYRCKTCHKDFVRLDLLRRHIRRHERGMVYRNSGGYTTSGHPGSGDVAGGTPFVERDDVRGQGDISEAQPAYDTTPTAPVSQQHQQQQMPAPPQPIRNTPQNLQAVDPAPWIPAPHAVPLSDAGLQHFTFFEGPGPNDPAQISQELDWIFSMDNSAPMDPSWNSMLLDQTYMDMLGTSPNSQNSFEPPTLSSAGTNDESEGLSKIPRTRILAALHTLPLEIQQSSFFDCENLEKFLDIYWEQYNPHFCFLHRPSFSVEDAPPLLLVALVSLGATLTPNAEHYEVAEVLHQNIRLLIFASPEFKPPAPLWTIQALLIIQAHEKMFSSRTQHELAHIFHYAVITLMRRGSSYTSDREDDVEVKSSVTKAWHRWIERESSYRAAYFAFIMDSQHSSIFGHSAALSLSDINLPLPCSDALWHASSAAKWNRERPKVSTPPAFVSALRSLLSRQPIPPTFSPFARFVLLHGLLCVNRHMISRDQMQSAIGQAPHENSTQPADHWQDRLDRAVDTWSFCLLSQTPSLCLEAARPLQRMVHVTIHVSLLDLHILAGAPSLSTGRPARPDSAEYTRARQRITHWANTKARRVLSNCLLLIQETMFTRSKYRAADDNIVLRPWCLYNATLVLWAYGTVTADSTSDDEDEPFRSGEQSWTAEQYLANMLNGIMGDGELSQLKGTRRICGLLTAVMGALDNCRWELLREAQQILGKLKARTSRTAPSLSLQTTPQSA